MFKLVLLLTIVAMFVLPVTSVNFSVYAQYGVDSVPKHELIGRCNDLGISPEEYTEQNILAREGKQVPRTEEAQPSFDFALTIGIVGAAIGASAIAVYLFILRTRKGINQTKQS